ncbi:hypothetical protein SMG44B_20341 [Stenotrophomonas maltophilia]
MHRKKPAARCGRFFFACRATCFTLPPPTFGDNSPYTLPGPKGVATDSRCRPFRRTGRVQPPAGSVDACERCLPASTWAS